MSKKPKPLYAEADEEKGIIIWSLDDKKAVEKGKTKTIEFPDPSEYAVSIEFKDNTKKGIIFKASEPIWVQDGGCCPPTRGINSTEIPKTSVVCGTDTLQFTNLNHTKGKLIYQLNFVDKHGVDVKPQLDPEFKNGGGGGGITTESSSFQMLGVAAAATALVVVVALYSMGKLG